MEFLIATRNRHKVEEIKAILGAEYYYRTLADFHGVPEIVEDAATFEGNATKKAVTIANWLTSQNHSIDYVIADDSGLEVDALKGAPGVHSARFAALDSAKPGNSPDKENNLKLLNLLSGVSPEKRAARFRCVIAFTPVPCHQKSPASPVCSATEAEMGTEIFAGTCEGQILQATRGAQGFGYDPLFVPTGFTLTFAELGEAQKNRISHRSQALARLKERLRALSRPA